MWQLTGHSRAITLLRQSLRSGQLSHAYLIVGPPHVGKSTLAMNLAQAVNCEGQDPPCQDCTPCRRILKSRHSDIHIVDLVSTQKEIGHRQVADMQTAAHLPPFEGRCKVFIFDRAEMLSHEAANSLLKTLEEPPPSVLIMLLTAREDDMLPTIASRCQRVELAPLPVADVKDLLLNQHQVEPDRAELLARLSAGCPGWALKALGEEGVLTDREERLRHFVRLATAPTTDRLAYAADLAGLFPRGRDRVADTLSEWLRWWRDVLLVKGGNSRWIVNVDREEDLRQEGARNTLEGICAFMRRITETARQLEQNASPRLALEVLLLNMP